MLLNNRIVGPLADSEQAVKAPVQLDLVTEGDAGVVLQLFLLRIGPEHFVLFI